MVWAFKSWSEFSDLKQASIISSNGIIPNGLVPGGPQKALVITLVVPIIVVSGLLTAIAVC